MIIKVKRKIVLGAVLLSASMALAACDINGLSSNAPNPSASFDNSTSYTSSAINDNSNSGLLSTSTSSSSSSIPVVLTAINAVSNKENYECIT